MKRITKFLSLLTVSAFCTSCGGITSPDGVLDWGIRFETPNAYVCSGSTWTPPEYIYASIYFDMEIDFSSIVKEVVQVEVKNNKNSRVLTHVFRYPSEYEWTESFAATKFELVNATYLGYPWICSTNLTDYTRQGWELEYREAEAVGTVTLHVFYEKN